MALLTSTPFIFGSEAPPFSLQSVDGKTYSLDSFRDRKGLLVVFMCNHCPYVVAVHERLSGLAREFAGRGIEVIGINSNDPLYKEADSFENMKKIAREWNLPFPYVFDGTQETARAYDAVCTPDPYLYEQVNGKFLLRYRGRIDDSWQDESKVKHRDLAQAMTILANGSGSYEPDPKPSMGCSIKWKELTAEALARKRS